MRAKEFIKESKKLDDVHDGLDVASLSLPNTFIIPELKNQDFYDLYRFGLAIAAVRGESGNDGLTLRNPKFKAETSWGEQQIVSSFDPNVVQVIDKALKKVNKSGKIAVSTSGSEEMIDTSVNSVLKPFRGYKKK